MDGLSAMAAVLLPVLAAVESNNNPQAVGDGGRAVGLYQLHKAYVEDVIRFTDAGYVLDDRLDADKSGEIVTAYLMHYGARYERITGQPATLEVLARMHNGGPDGFGRECTLPFWEKCKRMLGKER